MSISHKISESLYKSVNDAAVYSVNQLVSRSVSCSVSQSSKQLVCRSISQFFRKWVYLFGIELVSQLVSQSVA